MIQARVPASAITLFQAPIAERIAQISTAVSYEFVIIFTCLSRFDSRRSEYKW